jgi:hypothetical protein
MKLNDATLTVTREQNFDINIADLADMYEQAMNDELYERISEDLDLGSDIADYVDYNDELRDKILSLVKAEMFKRVSAKNLTIITKV